MPMRFLLHIDFGSPARLKGRVKYFEYGGFEFKMIRNSAKWANVLLTLVGPDDDVALQKAYAAGCEFLSAFCWQVGFPVAVSEGGGMTVPANQTLRQARCRSFGFPLVVREDRIDGFSISRLPLIETAEQRLGLTLYREAQSSNKVWLSFLFYWQILEIGGRPSRQVVEEIERAHPQLSLSRERQELSRHVGGSTDLRGNGLAQYFEEECRHAIAHIMRRPGRRTLAFDSLAENRRMAVSRDVIQGLAAHFIRDHLGLSKTVDLVRPVGGGFPRYVELRTARRGSWVFVDR